MVSVSLNEWYTKLCLQHSLTALFTVEFLKENSKHGTATTQNRLNTVPAYT